jgi:hypothetical protein
MVHSRHLHGEPRLCIPGARAFFERHRLDWRRFLRHGIEAEVLIATGDAMAMIAVSRARAEAGGRATTEAADGRQQ